jgi:hypothetical protein
MQTLVVFASGTRWKVRHGLVTEQIGGYRTSVLSRVGHNASCLTSIAMPHHLMLTTARLRGVAAVGTARWPEPGLKAEYIARAQLVSAQRLV